MVNSTPNIRAFTKFYATDLGDKIADTLIESLPEIAPPSYDSQAVAVGYPFPYLDILFEDWQHVAVAMPANLGATAFQHHQGNCCCLVEQDALPFAPNSVDYLFVIHTFEYVADYSDTLQEYHQILAAGGKLLLIVPNRLHPLGHLSDTPIGIGENFRTSELMLLLEKANYTVTSHTKSIYFLPADNPLLLSFSFLFEYAGKHLLPFLGGMHIIEAEKRIYARPTESYKRKALLMPKGVNPIPT